jgi:ATP-dependent DNA helicase RecG
LKRSHPSRPRNPLIADVCFKGGYIDSWGTRHVENINACREAELPEPSSPNSFGGILVEIFKNRYTAENLKKSGLNERQLMAVTYVKENGSITNSKYQTICRVSKSTATRDIKELEDKRDFSNQGLKAQAPYMD